MIWIRYADSHKAVIKHARRQIPGNVKCEPTNLVEAEDGELASCSGAASAQDLFALVPQLPGDQEAVRRESNQGGARAKGQLLGAEAEVSLQHRVAKGNAPAS